VAKQQFRQRVNSKPAGSRKGNAETMTLSGPDLGREQGTAQEKNFFSWGNGGEDIDGNTVMNRTERGLIGEGKTG